MQIAEERGVVYDTCSARAVITIARASRTAARTTTVLLCPFLLTLAPPRPPNNQCRVSRLSPSCGRGQLGGLRRWPIESQTTRVAVVAGEARASEKSSVRMARMRSLGIVQKKEKKRHLLV